MFARSRHTLVALSCVSLVLGCGEAADGPLAATDALTASAVAFDAVPARLGEENSAVYWNGVARSLVIANRSSAPFAIRAYAIVSVAQYNAVIAAERGKLGADHPSVSAATGASSVAALTYLYPAQASALESLLAEFLAGPGWVGAMHQNASMGEAIGRAVAEQVVARARNDNFFATGTVTVPTGVGVWFSSSPPVGALWGQAKTFILESGDQLRPPPPPAYGSAEFNAALAEVRLISDTRTPEQNSNAIFWDAPPGTHTPPGHWNEEAASLAVKYRLSERESAHMFALINMVSFDAIVASHAAKYFYWFPRPTMADPMITLSIGLPNFPAYPSNHATISGGMARILADRFPAEKARLEAMAEEAALSRVLGGIHYRFDGDAGLALGRAIAELALTADVVGHEPIVLR